MQTERLPAEWFLKDIVPLYRGIILDIFGVLHDGVTVFEPVYETLSKLRAGGMRVCLLSNSPRRAAVVSERLSELGLGSDLYDGLISSGEMVHAALAGKIQIAGLPTGQRYLHAGPSDLAGLLDGLALKRVAAPAEADFILATGEIEPGTLSLEEAGKLGLPMVCANPDLEVIIAGQRIVCAGALAIRYEAIGGTVIRIGKPELPGYVAALRVLDLPASEVVAIGDSFATDIAGASGAGIASALALTGIHRDELLRDGLLDVERLATLCGEHRSVPGYILRQFSWT
ncbi:TIGR01459 family HAD-type hydrolase [Rhizobium sp. BE258]|uniref:TIGR01459 family HAD-type hydrolase n=1 Tax=Rhizobium sp. BE258 TaxID=2817722 RepID=UPI002857D4CB|nr:TIGR01459 family HAD-type hydrolase [Rhizobium sp. BE258]MDR7145143.1 HAD superfamily hydrolase (TIGR01459 family) [Rhizobium sp. BE258]